MILEAMPPFCVQDATAPPYCAASGDLQLRASANEQCALSCTLWNELRLSPKNEKRKERSRDEGTEIQFNSLV